MQTQWFRTIVLALLLAIGLNLIFNDPHRVQGQTNKDYGYALLPSTSTAVTTDVLAGRTQLYFNNTDTATRTITVTDTAGNAYLSAFPMAANSNLTLNLAVKITGLKWSADVAAKVGGQVTALAQ
jgi:hypothetical protein